MRVLARALFPVVILAAAITADAATVSGTVTATGVPLRGMVVSAYDSGGILRATASTDATGFYGLSIQPGEYRFLAFDPAGVYATAFDGNAESFETSTLRTIPPGGAQISFALVKGGVVTGLVETTGGVKHAGAVVEAYNLSGTRRGFTTSGGGGSYSLVLPPGKYKLVAYDPNGVYDTSFHSGVRTFAEATPVQVTEALPAIVDFRLGIAAHVSGTAVDAVTHLPLPSILVYAFTPAGAQVSVTTTDASGAFRFTLAAGEYRFVAADTSRVYATAYYDGSNSFEGARVVTVAAGEQRSGVELALRRGARVSGHVNAANLVVAAYNLDGTLHATTTSDAAGNYTLVVAPGEYRIAVSDPSLVYATLFYGGVTDFRFAPILSIMEDMSGVDVTLPRGGQVSGTVRNSSSQGLSGITVAAYDALGRLIVTSMTGSDGRYVLVVAPGIYRFVAFDARLEYVTSYTGGATSYETAGPLAVEMEATITADFTTRRGVRASGFVTTENGNALTGIEVFALDASGNRVAGAVSRDGAFTIVLLPGAYRFIAVDPFRRFGPSDLSADVTIVEGQSPPAITLVLKSPARRRSVGH